MQEPVQKANRQNAAKKTEKSWKLLHWVKTVWANDLNAVYFRRDLTCSLGLTNNLMHCRWWPTKG